MTELPEAKGRDPRNPCQARIEDLKKEFEKIPENEKVMALWLLIYMMDRSIVKLTIELNKHATHLL